MSNQIPSDSSPPPLEPRPGDVYQVNDHDVARRVRVVSRSLESPGYWVCEDLDRGETLRLAIETLKRGAKRGEAGK